MKGIRTLLVSLAVVALAACADAPVTSPDGVASSRGALRPPKPATSPTIVDVALAANAATGEFSTLVAAVLAAGLADELSATGQRTVFAPTDAAFAKLGLNAGNVATALPREQLVAILGYHVAAGRRTAADVVTSDQIRMSTGQLADVEVTAAGAFIDGARIIDTDIAATNGIIHVVDSVLLP